MNVSKSTALTLLGSLAVAAIANAAVLLEETKLISRSAPFEAVAPESRTFTISSAGSYSVTLSDIGFPTALTSAELVVTRGVEVSLRMTQTGSMEFTAQPGDYTVRAYGSGASAGTLGVSIAPSAGGTPLLAYQSSIAGNPAAGDPNRSTVATSFSITQSGSYQVTVTDRQFPAALTSVDLLIVTKSGTPVARVCIPANPPVCAGNSATFNAMIGDYDLFSNALASSSAQAGLYSVRIDDVSAGVPYGDTFPVGALKPLTSVTLPAAQYSLQVSDLVFPTALTSIRALIAQGDSVLATLAAAGTQSFTAAQGAATVYVVASAANSSSVGAFGTQITQGSQSFFSDVRAVTGSSFSTVAGGARAYAFNVPLANAGQYQVQSYDFAFPASIPSFQMLLAQNGAKLGSLGTSGSVTVTAQSGPMIVLVIANMLSGTSTGLFSVLVDAQPSGQQVFAATQGVGDLFHSRTLTVSEAKNLDIATVDLGFPAAFADLALTVTRGNTLVGQIFGGGKFPFAATPGTYTLNFIARAATAQNYGLYGVKVEDSPPPPTVTLNVSPAVVSAGGTTTVTWSSAGATSCVASGDWSGVRPTSGTASNIGPFASIATLNLTCSGAGGSTAALARVFIASESSSGSGEVDITSLVALLSLAPIGESRRRKSKYRPHVNVTFSY
jgi:hypothetical protein